MEGFLIFLKHRVKFLWKIIEWGNGLLFTLIFKRLLERVLPVVLEENPGPPLSYRRLNKKDAEALFNLVAAQSGMTLAYFHPHGFDLVSIQNQFRNRAFLMMGVFDNDKLVGYFFLRFFANRKSFVGRLVDFEYRGRGIGRVMNRIMYETAWGMQFRCLSTISKDNSTVMRAHANNPTMKVLKELKENYLLVEFVQQD